MTSRTPPPLNYPNFGKEAKENKDEKPNIIDYSGPNTNKAGINQSPVGGNNTNTTTIENRPVNRGYGHIPSNNYSALFDIEYYHKPYINKKESKDANETVAENRKNSASEKSVKHDKERTEADENRNRDLDKSLEGRAELDMAYEGYRVKQLEKRNKLHSAAIHDLERQLRNVRMENNAIKGQFAEQDEPYTNNGFTERGASYDKSPERYQDRPNNYTDPRYSEAQGRSLDQDPPVQPGRPQYKNEQHRIGHRHGGADEEPYWGFNKYYNPQFVTAYRREHVPYYAKVEEKEKQTQYDEDYNERLQYQQRLDEEWRRKRRAEDERLRRMQDKPRTYQYTTEYQSLYPTGDVYKVFPPPEAARHELRPEEYSFTGEAPFKQNPGTGVSTYERAFIPPQHGFVQDQRAGGLYLFRFEDSGFEDVKVALRLMQSIIKTYFGYVLGIARKQHVYPIEGDLAWKFSRDRFHRHSKIQLQTKNVEEAICVIWFPSKEKAQFFFDNTKYNPFRDPCFPTPHSYEAYYIPLLTPPILSQWTTYLVIELLNAARYPKQNLQDFQANARPAIMEAAGNDCQPFVASALEGRCAFKQNSLLSDRSKVFISRFTSMSELSNVWNSGIIQDKLRETGLSGPRNVWAFSLQDWDDQM